MKTTTLKIHYKEWIKNKQRGGKKYYCRVSEQGQKPYDIPLGTEDVNVARSWVRLREQELAMYNSYVMAGEAVPEQVARKIVRRSNQVAQETAVKRLDEVIEAFCASCATRGLRATSQYSYLRSLRAICKAADVPLSGPCPEMDRAMLERLVASYSGTAPATKHSYNMALKQFAAYVQKQMHGHANNEDITDCIPRVKTDRKSHTVWTMSEMMRICEQAPSLEVRIYWSIMATVGPRNTELSLCRWGDYHDGFIHLKAEYTKGRKARALPIDFRIQGLLSELRNGASDGELIFAHIPTSNMGRNVQLRKACLRAGVKAGTCHTFRHSCAFYYFRECPPEKRLNIKDVAALLGHTSETVTLQIYLEATGSEELSSKVQAALMEEPAVPSTLSEHMDLI